jgi:pantoate--beta-alanine ligase
MQEYTSIDSLRSALAARGTRSLGFVPTMGNLHPGHIALIHEARAHNDLVACSIFVNPLQFGPNEDLDAYPRTLEDDRAALRSAGCDVLFLPNAAELIGGDPRATTRVQVPELGSRFCGASRPGHFDGVSTIVTKLFNIVQPDDAYFGLKDYQQFLIISKMTADLALPVRLHGVETQREPSGLALSSRNGYLTAEERERAPLLFSTLQDMARRLGEGPCDHRELIANARDTLTAAGLRVDYLAIASATDLSPATAQDRELIILSAAFLGGTRLIDNLRVTR